jgi:hypothetical protein
MTWRALSISPYNKVFVGGYKRSQVVALGGGLPDEVIQIAFLRAYDVTTVRRCRLNR